MDIFILHVWALYHHALSKFNALVRRAYRKYRVIKFRMAIRIPARYVFAWAYLKRSTGFYAKGYRLRACVANANQHCLLPQSSLNYTLTANRREIIEFYSTWGQDTQILQQIDCCAEELRRTVNDVVDAGTPLILAPLHMVSDVAAVIVASKANPIKSTVVVSSNANEWNARARAQGNIDVDYCSVEQTAQDIGLSLATACIDVSEGTRGLIVFADMVPDYSMRKSDKTQDTFLCRMFDRPAHLHNGLIRLSKVTKADVIFFHLYYDQQIKIRVLPAVSYKNVRNQLPGVIEQAITQFSQDWLLWHQHCLYFINE
ncbi:TPA: hypothetical protein N2F56_001296 [Salmonella enterica]|nr:hypothetical protein [Salmonella enterica]HCL4433058.1 hypothetical protein [Salmonella enterica]HCL5080913.1 hypothetical protein [Salmonella enterica]HCL5332019.1 hypothetical protein [Salmonella enterica]